ncbi:hypothetical protein GCM10009663_21630 [Kitasatospora arboriphila]|uniref:DUF748 domain-containing protein n=1 Tax=Kitasatospora arboriphila TaxID=258052 RepID=A0ABN1TH51_9ACTN
MRPDRPQDGGADARPRSRMLERLTVTRDWKGHRPLLACSLALAVGATALLGMAAQGSSAQDSSGQVASAQPGGSAAGHSAADHSAAGHGAAAASPAAGKHGGHAMAGTDGLAPERDGYRLEPRVAGLPAARPVSFPFVVTGPDGRPVTEFAESQTKRMHLYAIRSDLTGYQHQHPVMAADGTWTADLAALDPGVWRVYASFAPAVGSHQGTEYVLGSTVTVPGTATEAPLPAAAGTAVADGYTLTVQGDPTSAEAFPLTVTATGPDGRPVTDLQPYLGSYAHLSAFHEGDLALAHLHPITPVTAGGGGPVLTFYALLAKPGNWRVFLQFQTGGRLHTAAVTLRVP